MQAQSPDNLDCPSVREIIPLIVKDDASVAELVREAAQEHIAFCHACRATFIEEFHLVNFLREQWGQVSRRTEEEVGTFQSQPAVPYESSAQAEARSVSRRPIVVRLLKVSAVAAVLLLAIGFAWRAHLGVPQAPAERTSSAAARIGTAEIISSTGQGELAMGQVFSCGREPTEILLGRMHRVVMNSGAEAAFHASPAGDGEKYTVDLRSGELYVEVIKGHPFEVKTGNARISITGTRFDVAAQEGRTDLVMLDGKVLFAGAKSGAIEVSAGCASSAMGDSAPSEPRPVDALAATAWARNRALINAVAQATTSHADLSDMLIDSSAASDLVKIDYQQWSLSHRDWFAREFPWIFRMQRTLKERFGIEADYIELLAVSGDIWQFRCARPWNAPIAIFDVSSAKRVCEHYQVEPSAMMEALKDFTAGSSASLRAIGNSAQAGEELFASYRSEVGRWQAKLSDKLRSGADLPPEVVLFSMRAGNFLSQTRTAAWLWAREHPDDELVSSPQWLPAAGRSPDEDPCSRQEWVEGLFRQAKFAMSADIAARELLVLPKATDCEARAATLARELRDAAAGLAAITQHD